MTEARMLTQFADAMAERLDANGHKSGWWDMSPVECLRRLKQEVGELERAVTKGESVQRIRHEAGDVGNFAAMLLAVYGEDA